MLNLSIFKLDWKEYTKDNQAIRESILKVFGIPVYITYAATTDKNKVAQLKVYKKPYIKGFKKNEN